MNRIHANARNIADRLLETTDPAGVAREIGMTFRGEQDWPEVGKLWDFSDMNPNSPTYTMTFYVTPGTSREEILQRYQTKKAERLAKAK